MRTLLILLAVIAAPAFAQEKVYRLSEEDKQAALEAASRQPETPLPLPIIDGRAPGNAPNSPHGEVGMMVGTGGTRALWGTTSIPLGENSSASLGFSTGRFPNFNGGFGSGFGGDFGGGLYGNPTIPLNRPGSVSRQSPR